MSLPLIVGEDLCEAKADFQGRSEEELSFRQGDVLAITTKIDSNWFEGRCVSQLFCGSSQLG